MYERFTDRARKALQLANQEAVSWNHDYVGVEHLLIGLLKVDGMATRVLQSLDVSVSLLQAQLEKRLHQGIEGIRDGKLPQTPRLKQVIEQTIGIARQCRHPYVGTEHLLLGLLSNEDGLAFQELRACEVTLEKAQSALEELLSSTALKNIQTDPAVQALARLLDPRLRHRQVLTCAFCGQEYPVGTPATQHDLLTQHVYVCPTHPIQEYKRTLRAICSWEVLSGLDPDLASRMTELAYRGEDLTPSAGEPTDGKEEGNNNPETPPA